MATAVFYASSTGNTSDVANMISKELGEVEVFDIADCGVGKMEEFDKLIIGTPTWGEGELQDDFEDAWDDFSSIDFSSKTVALFGLGDQEGYGEYFLDAMGLLHEVVSQKGANMVGSFEVSDDYEFEESKAVVDGCFVGLAIDEDNQSELTEQRVNQWCSDIKDKIL